jgi:hypothetical protein
MHVCIRWSEVRRRHLTQLSWLVNPHVSIVVGKHVITVEGLGSVNNPHPLQERLAKLHGSQYVFHNRCSIKFVALMDAGAVSVLRVLSCLYMR